MARLFANNAKAVLASGGIDDTTTTINLETGQGANFPSPSDGDYFDLTLTQAGAESSWEIVKVTARSSDALTVTRAQYGTSAASWSAGDKAELRANAAMLTDLLEGRWSDYTITDGGSVDIDPAKSSVQKWTLGANRTPTATNFENGQHVLLKIDDGTAYAVTWTSVVDVWVGGSAPTLPTTGYGLVLLWMDDGVVYGAYVGDA